MDFIYNNTHKWCTHGTFLKRFCCISGYGHTEASSQTLQTPPLCSWLGYEDPYINKKTILYHSTFVFIRWYCWFCQFCLYDCLMSYLHNLILLYECISWRSCVAVFAIACCPWQEKCEWEKERIIERGRESKSGRKTSNLVHVQNTCWADAWSIFIRNRQRATNTQMIKWYSCFEDSPWIL